MGTSPISDEQLESYWKNGYVVAPGLLPATDCAAWTERLRAIVEGDVAPSEGMLVMKDVMVAKGAVAPGTRMEAIAKIQDYENDPVLDRYTVHPQVLDCVERFIGHDVQTIHTMLINKPPNVDGRHPLHQDLLYFPFRPADQDRGHLDGARARDEGERLPRGRARQRTRVSCSQHEQPGLGVR